MTTKLLPKIGIIVGSLRTPRAGPQISDFILSTIQKSNPAASLSLIDLATWNLPLVSNEPGIPAYITSSDGYEHEYTRRWSREINSYAAFVFVTPQYNWGYPASLKNALDYLFNEWKGKPGLVISYGGNGGDKAAVQLMQVLQGLRMRPAEKPVCLKFPEMEFTKKAASGQDLELSAEGEGVWSKERDEIVDGFETLMKALDEENRMAG